MRRDSAWISQAALPIDSYLGIDIVESLIVKNRQLYGRESVSFHSGDLRTIELPACDLILYHDCLVHLSVENIRRVLLNFLRSGSRYLLTTTFSHNDLNMDIENGDWRMLNLRQEPFGFANPILLINEEREEVDGAYRDKSLGLWKLESLKRLQFLADTEIAS